MDEALRRAEKSKQEYQEVTEHWIKLHFMIAQAYSALGQTPERIYDNEAAKVMRAEAPKLWQQMLAAGITPALINYEVAAGLHPFVQHVGEPALTQEHLTILSDPAYALPQARQIVESRFKGNLQIDTQGLPAFYPGAERQPYNLFIFAGMNYFDMADMNKLLEHAQTFWFADQPNRGFGRHHRMGYAKTDQLLGILHQHGMLCFKDYTDCEGGFINGGVFYKA